MHLYVGLNGLVPSVEALGTAFCLTLYGTHLCQSTSYTGMAVQTSSQSGAICKHKVGTSPYLLLKSFLRVCFPSQAAQCTEASSCHSGGPLNCVVTDADFQIQLIFLFLFLFLYVCLHQTKAINNHMLYLSKSRSGCWCCCTVCMGMPWDMPQCMQIVQAIINCLQTPVSAYPCFLLVWPLDRLEQAREPSCPLPPRDHLLSMLG